ncbi:YmaF family protein [Brevibacillus sp. B_LB10_24]|uniref:YmaF family protein n=1 Tax=Brevibacillus sp. B_LB10_24 TaxID=3380645 RepID=UPI0038B947FE
MAKGHKHEVEFVSWYHRNPVHIHDYAARTSVNFGHRHWMGGNTTPADGGMDHVHFYEGTTSYDSGHVHHFRGCTGPAIPLPDGSHYHDFGGETSYDKGHSHCYQGRTSPAIEC